MSSAHMQGDRCKQRVQYWDCGQEQDRGRETGKGRPEDAETTKIHINRQ